MNFPVECFAALDAPVLIHVLVWNVCFGSSAVCVCVCVCV